MKPKLDASEIDLAKKLKAQHAALDAHLAAFRPSKLNGDVTRSEERYMDEPSDSNFSALKAATFERELLALAPRLPSFTHAAFQRFLVTKVQPFFRPILERSLKASERRLEKIRADEYAKIEQVTGHPAGPHIPSKAIEAAQEPIESIKFLLMCIDDDATITSLDNFFASFFDWAEAN